MIFSRNFQNNFCQRFLGNYLLQILKILSHSLLRHAILWNLFCINRMPTYCLISYFAYSHPSGGITSKHWLRVFFYYAMTAVCKSLNTWKWLKPLLLRFCFKSETFMQLHTKWFKLRFSLHMLRILIGSTIRILKAKLIHACYIGNQQNSVMYHIYYVNCI